MTGSCGVCSDIDMITLGVNFEEKMCSAEHWLRISSSCLRFGVFTAVKIQIMVFWFFYVLFHLAVSS
jgi:hypothetical protein